MILEVEKCAIFHLRDWYPWLVGGGSNPGSPDKSQM